MNSSPRLSEVSPSQSQTAASGRWRAGTWLEQESSLQAKKQALVSLVLVCSGPGALPAPGSSRNSREARILGVRAWWSAMACFLQDRAPFMPLTVLKPGEAGTP